MATLTHYKAKGAGEMVTTSSKISQHLNFTLIGIKKSNYPKTIAVCKVMKKF
jgi:hypothetical protein